MTEHCLSIMLHKIEDIPSVDQCVELRLDILKEVDFNAIVKATRGPVILTDPKRSFSKEELQCLPKERFYLDFPTAQVGYKNIASWHDYKSIPENLQATWDSLKEKGSDCIKIAVTPSSILEALDLVLFKREQKSKGIVLGMGEYGKITRLLSHYMDNTFLYTRHQCESPTAPGQLSEEELEPYPLHSKPQFLLGLIGDPVEQSLGHLIHNAAIKAFDIPSIYIKMPVKKEEIPSFLHKAQLCGFRGLSVTMPLKTAVLPYIHAPQLVSCNTLTWTGNEWIGNNTDTIALIKCLKKIGEKSLDKLHCVVIGAGSTGHAIVQALREKGAYITLLNRTVKKAKEIALQYSCNYGSLHDMPASYDCLINCSSVGMFDDQCPIATKAILANTIIADFVYKKDQSTTLITTAKKLGCRVIDGQELLLTQAAEQWECWT